MNKGIQDSTIDFLIDQEGARDVVYKDSGGADTVGVGHLIILPGDAHYFGRTLSAKEISDLLLRDLVPFEETLKKVVKVKLNQNQHDALISLMFNIGKGAFSSSTLVKYINAGRGKSDIIPAWKAWNHDAGKEVQALTDRRQREIDLYYR